MDIVSTISICSVSVRLVGGASSLEGRLEVSLHRDNQWGTVCDNGFTYVAARVVCYMLGQG